MSSDTLHFPGDIHYAPGAIHYVSAGQAAPHHPEQPLFLPLPRGLTGAHVQLLHELAEAMSHDKDVEAEPVTKKSLQEIEAFSRVAHLANGAKRLSDSRAALLRVCSIAFTAVMVLDVRIWARIYPGEPALIDSVITPEQVSP